MESRWESGGFYHMKCVGRKNLIAYKHSYLSAIFSRISMFTETVVCVAGKAAATRCPVTDKESFK